MEGKYEVFQLGKLEPKRTQSKSAKVAKQCLATFAVKCFPFLLRALRNGSYFSRAITNSGAHNNARLISESGNVQIAFRAASAYCAAFAFAASSAP